MEAIDIILIFFATLAVLIIGEYHSLTDIFQFLAGAYSVV